MSDAGINEIQLQNARDLFDQQFGNDQVESGPIVAVRAPGRVNLIGEHTDYNDGFVFPMAIDREIAIVGRKRNDRQVRVCSGEYEEVVEFNLDLIESSETSTWSNYFKGTIDVLQKAGYRLAGLDAVVLGNVPQGAGLSSSAAFEVATATLCDELFGLNISPKEKAVLAQKAENEFVGVACGIMDQFISAAGKAGHGLFLDCRSLEYEHVPLHLDDAAVMVINTNKRRGLVDSEYNTRRRECEIGAAFFAKLDPAVKALRDVTLEQFEAHQESLDDVVRRRCRHVITECARTLESVEALRAGDLNTFGQLMNASHDSLRDDFEVSCRELDVIVELARGVEGVYGARMTGGGFGGCAVALVRQTAVDAVTDVIQREYPKATGLTPDIFVFDAAEGAGRASL